MLAIFARLYAGEAIISREQDGPAAIGVRRVLAVLAGVMVGFAAAARRALSRIARPCAAAGRRLSRAARVPNGRSPAADNPADPRRPLGL